MVLYALTRLAMIDLAGGRWTDAAGDAPRPYRWGGNRPPRPGRRPGGHPDAAGGPSRRSRRIRRARPSPRRGYALGTAGILDVVLRDVVHWAHGVHLGRDAGIGVPPVRADVPRRQKRMAGTDRIEAAVRADQTEAARLWIDDLAGFAAATGQTWASAVAEHGEALLADPETAESHFVRALELHDQDDAGGPGSPVQPGPDPSWRTASSCAGPGAGSMRAPTSGRRWRPSKTLGPAVGRTCCHELRSSGETARKRDETAPVDLTPQERQVAQLVRAACPTGRSLPALRQPPHRRLPPAQRVRQDRRHLAWPSSFRSTWARRRDLRRSDSDKARTS